MDTATTAGDREQARWVVADQRGHQLARALLADGPSENERHLWASALRVAGDILERFVDRNLPRRCPPRRRRHEDEEAPVAGALRFQLRRTVQRVNVKE